MNRPSYYPPRHADIVASQWRCAAWGVGLPTVVLAGAISHVFIFDGPVITFALALALFLVFAWWSFWSVYDTTRHVRIIPYFERTVGDIDTFVSGDELARNCGKLDELATEGGQQGLSAFGFNDDLCGETVIWHAADIGRRSVEFLIDAVRTQPTAFDNPETVITELERLSLALRRADERRIGFCLLLRHGRGTSGQEWSVRKGTAF